MRLVVVLLRMVGLIPVMIVVVVVVVLCAISSIWKPGMNRGS